MVAFTVFRRDHSSRLFYAPPAVLLYNRVFADDDAVDFMIRITELRLPLEHPADALPAAIAQRLGVTLDEVLAFTIFKRGYDARKRDAIVLVYTIDVTIAAEAAVLARFSTNQHINPSPDTRYQPVAQAPENLEQRPVIVGFGPCGIMAGLLLAQMGFRPLILERGKNSF